MDKQEAKKKLFSIHRIEGLEKFLMYISFIFLTFGTVTIISALIKNPHDVSSIVLAIVYPIFWGISILSARKVSPFGDVKDSENHQGISLALVRIIDENGHLVKTAVTNELGKFKTLVSHGKYKIVVAKPGYEQQNSIELDAEDKIEALKKQIELDKKV